MSAPTRYAVVGDPVSHSLSPLMHTTWMAEHALSATYEAYRLRTDNPVAALRKLTQFTGMNVTAPYKEAAAAAADRKDGSVANVLRREPDGSLSAFNTDGAGFVDSLDEAAVGWRDRARRTLILGAGGAAQGIAAALAPTVETITIANRTRTHAEQAASALSNGHVCEWGKLTDAFAEADLIVQATTLGAAGTESPIWPLQACAPHTIIADIVYRPLETPLLARAKARGLTIVDGLAMLIHQGARSFEIWFGVKPDAGKARTRLEAALA